jgi:hypothetical protein
LVILFSRNPKESATVFDPERKMPIFFNGHIVIKAGVPSEAAWIMAPLFKNRAIMVAKALKILLKKGQEPGRGAALAGNSNS